MLKWFVSVLDANTAMNDGVELDVVASVQARHEDTKYLHRREC